MAPALTAQDLDIIRRARELAELAELGVTA